MSKKIKHRRRISFKEYMTMRFDKVAHPVDDRIVGKLVMKGNSITTVEGKVVLTVVN